MYLIPEYRNTSNVPAHPTMTTGTIYLGYVSGSYKKGCANADVGALCVLSLILGLWAHCPP